MIISHLLHSTIFILLSFTHHHQAHAQPNDNAPSPTPWPIDITAILEKAGRFSIFIKFMDRTGRIATQINTQVITSAQGVTVLAPTDAAFGALPSGALNRLSVQQKVQLIQYHVLPKFYSLDDLETATNPVGTQASGSDGGNFWLNFTGGMSNQVNVSSGVVETQVSNALRQKFPLAVYQVDKVLLPVEFTRAPSAAAGRKKGSGRGANRTVAAAPKEPITANSNEPSPADNHGGAARISVGLASGVVFYSCMSLL
ncbi:unnamed protein product [Cuscuta campestris]|uniref:FAS1 domain-containing protein n=1 Tax=Cuscuta campestris TaxID=132261 RepID=A0A484M0T5_9ASTE|nr:unnamed protein product [Cuscuta campestris]